MAAGKEWIEAADEFILKLNTVLDVAEGVVRIECSGNEIQWLPSVNTIEIGSVSRNIDDPCMFHHDCRTPRFSVDGTWYICAMVSDSCGITLSMLTDIEVTTGRRYRLTWDADEHERPEHGFETEVEE